VSFFNEAKVRRASQDLPDLILLNMMLAVDLFNNLLQPDDSRNPHPSPPDTEGNSRAERLFIDASLLLQSLFIPRG